MTTQHLYIVRFTDHADKLHIRSAFLDAHLKYLAQFKDMVLLAGSLRPEAGENAIGGLWIMRAHSAKEIEAFIDNDPFWKEGLRKSREILHWTKTGNEQVLI